jgi:uncharacterized membrane protein (UPF0136 family)
MKEAKSTEPRTATPEQNPVVEPQREKSPQSQSAAKFPGVAAIAFWMLLEALIGVMGVFTHHFSSQASRFSVLALSTLLALAGLGLLRMKRWGWALALAAAFLTSSYGVYVILRSHQQNYWVMTIVNFIFFFYLVRPEILRRLR